MRTEMKNIIFKKSIIIAVALSGAVINAVYFVAIFKALFDPQYNNTIREIIISAAVLEIGWIALLLWVAIKPFERRHILLFTIVPILLGNIFHSVNQFQTLRESLNAMALNTALGLLYSGLYLVAFLAGKGKKISRPCGSLF